MNGTRSQEHDNQGISRRSWVHRTRQRLERLMRRPRHLVEQAPEPRVEECPPCSSGMVLIVEMSGWTCGSLPALLGQMGYDAQVVRGQEAALNALQHDHPALLIVGGAADLNLYSALRRASPARILALVPEADKERVLAAFAAGVDDCQSGPMGNREVVARVRAILRYVGQASPVAVKPSS